MQKKSTFFLSILSIQLTTARIYIYIYKFIFIYIHSTKNTPFISLPPTSSSLTRFFALLHTNILSRKKSLLDVCLCWNHGHFFYYYNCSLSNCYTTYIKGFLNPTHPSPIFPFFSMFEFRYIATKVVISVLC